MIRVIHWVGLVLALLLLAGCQVSPRGSSPPTLVPPNTFTQAYVSLDSETIKALGELTELRAPGHLEKPLKVWYILNDDLAVAVYSEGGRLVGWNVATAALVLDHPLGIVSSKALALTGSGSRIVGATRHLVKTDRFQHQTEYVNGVALWDIYTGELIQCITFPCKETASEESGFLGLTAAPDGKWLAIFDEYGLGLSDVPGNALGHHITLNGQEGYQWQVGAVAFDQRNQRYAVVFQEGRISLSDTPFSRPTHEIAKGKEGEGQAIRDAEIDPSGRWLVITRATTIQVWKIGTGHLLLQIGTSEPALAFDQAGTFLLVGVENKLKVYSLETADQVAEYEAQGISTLAISEDNRLILWGDSGGIIHVWGKASR